MIGAAVGGAVGYIVSDAVADEEEKAAIEAKRSRRRVVREIEEEDGSVTRVRAEPNSHDQKVVTSVLRKNDKGEWAEVSRREQ